MLTVAALSVANACTSEYDASSLPAPHTLLPFFDRGGGGACLDEEGQGWNRHAVSHPEPQCGTTCEKSLSAKCRQALLADTCVPTTIDC